MHNSKFDLLLHYISRGWALVPLHDVSAGCCSCARDCGGSAGKHPRYARWQEPDQLVRDERALASLLRGGGADRWNWGVATGPISGIWVLDVDPASGGEAALATLERELNEQGETLPNTLTLGPTGGGGGHLIFAWPADGRVIHGSQTKNRYGLAPGLDIRGTGGQIVVAPSVSGKGPYGGVLVDAPVAHVGPVLLDRLTGGEVGATLRSPPGATASAGSPRILRPDAPDGMITGGWAAGTGAAGGMTAARHRAYAEAARRALLDELLRAPVGTRNDTAFRVACRLIELVNAPWAGLTEEGAYAAWWEVAGAHPDGVRVPAGELVAVWRSAVARVGDGVAAPPGDDGWHGVGGEVIPFSSISPAVGSASGGAEGGSSGGVGQARTTSDDPVQALIDAMLTPEQLREMPPPEPLVNGVLDLDTCAWLIGAPGSYKSFVALDLAAHVGRGEAWRGHAVHQGLVVYVAAEGARGMRLRVDAWEREYGPLKDVRVLPSPVQADERVAARAGAAGAWSVLVEAVRKLRPVLVIVDTQARVTVGLNENDNTEMSYYAEQADRIKRACGACVLTVHHTGRSGTNARGASAIDGAQDAELRLERKGLMRVELHMDKQKDQAEEAPTAILLRRSEGGEDSRTGRDLSSLVLAREDADDPFMDPGQPVNKTQGRAIALYKLIFERFNGGVTGAGDGGTRADVRTAFLALPDVCDLNPDAKRKAFNLAWNALLARNLLIRLAGAERFRVVIVADQSSEGVLTPNDGSAVIPEGWNPYNPGDGMS